MKKIIFSNVKQLDLQKNNFWKEEKIKSFDVEGKYEIIVPDWVDPNTAAKNYFGEHLHSFEFEIITMNL